VFSFLQHTFEARVTPDGKLVDLKPETGFLGENWDSNQGGYQDLKIAPYSDFIEEQQEGASWLVNEAFAKDWRSFQKFGEVKR
jgi:hypothetical protein